MFPLSHIAPFSVPFSKGSREKRVFAQKADTTYVIKNSKLYNWIFYVGREVSGSVYCLLNSTTVTRESERERERERDEG